MVSNSSERVFEVMQVPHARLDQLSQALAAKPLSSDELFHLVLAGFHRTVLAKSMAQTLVADAMPHLVDPADASYAAWQEVLVHALVLPPDRWEIECVALRPKLSWEIAHKVPLLAWLREALYRPADLPAFVWHTHMASHREAGRHADAQIVARHHQINSSSPGQSEQAIRRRLCKLLPTLGQRQVEHCMTLVRRHGELDRGILDVRVALSVAFDHVSKEQIEAVYAAAVKPSGGFPPCTWPIGGRRSTMLLEIGRDAQLVPSYPPVISHVQSVLNGIWSVPAWIRRTFIDHPMWPTSMERGGSRREWAFEFPVIFPGADAAVPPSLSAVQSTGRLWPQRTEDGNASGPAATQGTTQIRSVETRGDLRILHDTLRAQQALLRSPNASSGGVSADQVFAPVGMHSPAAAYASGIASVLTHLKLRAASEGALPDIYEAMEIGRSGIDQLRVQRSFCKLDLAKPITVALYFDASEPSLRFNGTGLRSGKTAVANIPSAHVKLLSAYVSRIRGVLSDSSHRPSKPENPHSASLTKLVIRDDGHVSLRSMLKFYGIALPDIATATDLEDAIKALHPKAALIAGSGDRKATAAMSFSVDMTNPPEPFEMALDEHETADYGVISEAIKLACIQVRDQRVSEGARRHGNSFKALLLQGLKGSGGVSLKLKVDDTDGEDNTYLEQHSVNPKNAASLEHYFDQSANQLGDYMERKIRDKDGEDEGAINISQIKLKLYVPHFVANDVVVTPDDVKIFDICSANPPFLPIDASLMTADANQAVSQAIGEITAESRISNGDVSRSPKLLATVKRAIELDGTQLSGPPTSEDRVLIDGAFDKVLKAYYRISSEGIKKQQRLLLAQQPTQEEFLCRAICRQLGIDERNWPIMMAHRIPLRYKVGLANRGSFVSNDVDVSKTLLEVVYDENLRKEIGLASDKEVTYASAARSVADACLAACDAEAVKNRMGSFFTAFNVLGFIGGISNAPLPEALIRASESFKSVNDQYIERAVDTFENLEAERMVLVSDTALERLSQARRQAQKRQATFSPVNFQALLRDNERAQLSAKAGRFRDLLAVRRNTDRFHDLQPGWSQAVAQLKGMALEICRNAPLQLCAAVNLLDDIVNGEDVETVALDGLFVLSSTLGGLESPTWRRLAAAGHAGANAWTLHRSVEGYKDAMKRGNYTSATKNLVGIIQSGHSVLASGASMVERSYGSISRGELQEASSGANYEKLVPEVASPVPMGAKAADRYWSVDEQGVFSRQNLGRKVFSSLWNGDLLVDGGASAIALNNDVATVYMLGDTPCQPVRTSTAALELWPVRDLALTENAWVARTDQSRVSYSRSGISAFPREFSAPAGDLTGLQHDAVTWFDNHVSIFEPLRAQHMDVDGQPIRFSTVNIGVLEHKYVHDREGVIETLEHLGTRDGRTQFARNDGSTLIVQRSIPPWPQYKSKIKATVVGSQGMFAAVEITEAIDGLSDKRCVSGAVAARKPGGHELIVELDAGVYYRGDIPSGTLLPLRPGSSVSNSRSFDLHMRKISAAADPKRASLALWHTHGLYRDSQIAHDDFALEVLFGSKLANRAYSNNYEWVMKQHELIRSVRLALPPEVRSTESPYYELSTSEADAILFAPRNRAVLADTLIASDVEWGALSSTGDVELVEGLLRDVQVNSVDVQDDTAVARAALLRSNERIPVDASERGTLYAQLKGRTRGRNLVFAEVETREGKKVQFVGMHGSEASEIVIKGNELGALDQGRTSGLGVTVKLGDKKIYGAEDGSVIGKIESVFPKPSDIHSIMVFSLDTPSHRLVEEIFTSSASGYKYRSVLRLRKQNDNPSDSASQDGGPEWGVIRPAQLDLKLATPVSEGPQKGAYTWGEDYYVPLDSGGMYRAAWDDEGNGFRLLLEESASRQVAKLPLVRRVNGVFRLANPPIGTGSKTLSHADKLRLKQELESNPTPAVLQTIRWGDVDVVLVSDPDLVKEKLKLDGRWVLAVDGVEYSPAITEFGTLAYVHDDPAEAMRLVCGPRSPRALEPLCVAGEGSYIQSKNAVKAADLPAEGTDAPDTEDWTPWTSDTRVYGTRLPGERKPPAWAKDLPLFPYEGKYCRVKAGKDNPSPLKAKELEQVGLAAQVTYASNVEVQLMYRKGHGARVRIENFETHLAGSKIEVGASIFKRKESDTEWIAVLYDGTWYRGTFDRPSGSPTPTTISMKKMPPEEHLTPEDRDLRRLHAGMQAANYHAKTASPESLMDAMEVNRHLGLSPAEFDGSDYFVISTTAEQAFLFDRSTRENVQVRARINAKWNWLKLDEVATSEEVVGSRNDLLVIAKAIFNDQAINSIDDLLRVSGDKKISIGPKNFLIVRENAGDIYFSISGKRNERLAPSLFKDSGRAEIDLNGKKATIVYIDVDPNLDKYMAALDTSGDYPRALPTAARPDQLSHSQGIFDVTASRAWDTERKMIAYLTQGGVSDRAPTVSVEVLNRNDACKSCASLLQQYFKPFEKVIHFYGNDYKKY